MVLFTGRERRGKSGIHSKNILIWSWQPTNIMPVTATLKRVNTALARFVPTEAFVAAARNEEKKQTNRRGFRQYSIARKFQFMRCICIWLGKVAGAWIWLQTIIKCGDNEHNEWGYLSKPLHAHWAFKGPSRRKLRTVSTKTGFKCRTIKVNKAKRLESLKE